MQQAYTYGDAQTAEPVPGVDGSRVISFFIFNTCVHVHGYAGDDEDARDPAVVERLDGALRGFRDRCVFFEHVFSRMREDSDIARAHAAAPAPVEVAPETAELVTLSLGYCERSRGLFDITMGTLTRLWDFHAGVVPSGRDLARALPHVGYSHIHVATSGGRATLSIDDPATVLDLGGVAKGYIADDLARLLERHGVRRFAMNLGGNVLVRGGRPADEARRPPVRAGAPWNVGIVNPRDAAHNRAVVRLASGSVVTSGIQERQFTRGGVTYHHILDPRTGMPARTDVASATIVADRSMDCDGWSTTAFMLGARDAIDFIEGLPGVEAVVIDDCDRVSWTSGISEDLSIIPTLPRL